MPETAVSDTGPILHLGEIDRLDELKQFDKVAVSDVVRAELRRHGMFAAAETALSDILEVHRVRLREITAQRGALSGFMLHRADLSVAALASRLASDVVLTDDLELRKALESHGALVVGSIGVLFRSFRNGHLSKDELRAVLESLFDDSTLYLSKGLKAYVCARLDALEDS
ncbi:MAG: hypothetical protein ACYC4F_11600 [Armatimonadota bacterium]